MFQLQATPSIDADPTETRRVVTALLRCVTARDDDAIAALFAEEVDWRLSAHTAELLGAVPWVRRRRPGQDVAAHFRALAAARAPERAATAFDCVLVEGAHAVLLGTLRDPVWRSGIAHDAHFVLRLTVERGRVVRYYVYEDSLTVSAAPPAPSPP